MTPTPLALLHFEQEQTAITLLKLAAEPSGNGEEIHLHTLENTHIITMEEYQANSATSRSK